MFDSELQIIEHEPPTREALEAELAAALESFRFASMTPQTKAAVKAKAVEVLRRHGDKREVEVVRDGHNRLVIQDPNRPLSPAEDEVLAGFESEGMYYFSDYTSPRSVEARHGELSPRLRELWEAYRVATEKLQSELDDLARRREINE